MTISIRMIPRSLLRGNTVPSPLAGEGRVYGDYISIRWASLSPRGRG